MRENTLKAGFKIIIASVCFILYSLLIVYPYWEKNASFRAAFGIWNNMGAQIVYAVLFYPAFWWYLRTLARHVLFVQYFKILAYPLCFLIVWAGFHGVFLIRDLPVVIGMATVTVPLGVVGLIIALLWGMKQDIQLKFFSEKTRQEKLEFNKQLFDLLTVILLPCLLVFFAVYSIRADIGMEKRLAEQKKVAAETEQDVAQSNEQPVEKKTKKEFRGFSFSNGCDYFTGVMREASERVEIGENDSPEQIAKAYETEFKKEDVYGKIELHDIKPEYAEFYLWQKGVVWLIFRFEKKGVCLPDSQNCSFSLLHGKDPCTQYAVIKAKQK